MTIFLRQLSFSSWQMVRPLGVSKFLLQKFGSFSVTLLEMELGLYTSVENRMLCLLLSGAGIASSCRKYSST